MAKVKKIGARKIVEFQTVAVSGEPRVVQVPERMPIVDGKPGEPESLTTVVVPTTQVGIMVKDDQDQLWYRVAGTPWMKVPGLEEDEIDMDDEQLKALRAQLEQL